MNTRLWAALLFSTTAAAQSPSDFKSNAPITPAEGDALQRFTLPFDAYRDARPDLSDIRVFNGKGEALPMAFAADPDPVKETPAAVVLATFPIYGPAVNVPMNESRRLDVRVRSGRDGTIISVYEDTRRDRTKDPIAWLVDATQLKNPVRYLVFDWNTGPGNELARVTIEASDDLISWRQVATRAPLLRVEQFGQVIAQRRVDLGSLKARYLRVTGEPAGFQLRRIEAQSDATAMPAARMKLTIAGSRGAKPGDYVYDLGARLPVETVRLVMPERNTIAPFTILARDAEGREPRRVTGATFYLLARDGVDIESPAVEIGRYSARHWVAVLDPRSPPPGAGVPTLEVQWRPAQVVFVARGDPPFTLAVGNPDAKRAVLAPSELIPGYERLVELRLPEAKVGATQKVERPFESLRIVMGDVSPKRVALWAILILAVAALAWMAWRLSHQMKAQPPPG